jgi:hypothetical protein
MPRALLPWLIAVGVLVLASVGAVVVLNATTFGAGAFVQVYLGALARGDVSDALTLPGVDAKTGADAPSAALLHDGTLGTLRDIHQTGDVTHGDQRWITVHWATRHGDGSTIFKVERVGTRFGLFPEWGFAVSPMATIEVTAAHDAGFTVNGSQQTSLSRSGAPVAYAVLVPGSYVLAHTSQYLTASPDAVLATTVNETLRGTVDTQANAVFTKAVARIVDAQLTSCATQTVLYPTGCPFGETITNRVSSTPAWSIVHPPVVSLVPGAEFGTWAIPATPGTAHLVVQVTSLYDGTVSSFDQDVPFLLQAGVTFDASGAISVIEHPDDGGS